MLTPGRILTLILALLIALGSPLAMPMPAQASPKAAEMRGAMGETHTASSDDTTSDHCVMCGEEAGFTQHCVAPCLSFPALTQHDAFLFISQGASYGSRPEQGFSDTRSRPDPYPPKLPVLI